MLKRTQMLMASLLGLTSAKYEERIAKKENGTFGNRPSGVARSKRIARKRKNIRARSSKRS